MEFEKLPALTRREEDEPGGEAESWKPTWKCYCCHDTGLVLDRLAARVIEGYEAEKSKIPRCHATGCGAEVGLSLEESGTLDGRLTPQICDRLAQRERESWSEYRWQQQRLRQKALGLIEEAASGSNLRRVKRSEEEEKKVRRRHLYIVQNY